MSADPPRSSRTAREPDPTEVRPDLPAPLFHAGVQPQPASDGAAPRRAPAASPPHAVPGYRDWVFLGSGTFGEVWRATQTATTIPVAIKFFVRSAGGVEAEV